MPFRVRLGPPRNSSWVSAILGALVCFSLCGTGLFVLLGGAEMSGGIPFLPEAINRGIGLLLLIFGILLTGLLGAFAVWEAWRLHQARHKG